MSPLRIAPLRFASTQLTPSRASQIARHPAGPLGRTAPATSTEPAAPGTTHRGRLGGGVPAPLSPGARRGARRPPSAQQVTSTTRRLRSAGATPMGGHYFSRGRPTHVRSTTRSKRTSHATLPERAFGKPVLPAIHRYGQTRTGPVLGREIRCIFRCALALSLSSSLEPTRTLYYRKGLDDRTGPVFYYPRVHNPIWSLAGR